MRKLLGLAALFVLAACASLPKPGAQPVISFDGQPRLQLKTEKLDIEDVTPTSNPSQALPANFLKPADVALSWARQRIATTGTTGIAHFRILESSVVENTLPASARIGGYGTSGQERTLVARLRAELVIDGLGGKTRALGEATAERRIRSALPPPELEAENDALLSELARRFDNVMTAQVGAMLTGF
jgi:hypothetical protein